MADSSVNENNQNSSAANEHQAVAVTGNQVGTPQQPQQQQQQQQQGFSRWGIVKTLFVRMMIIYFISSLFRRGSQPQGDTRGSAPATISSTNLFPRDTLLDMYVYISEKEKFSDFDNKDALFWVEDSIAYGDWTAGLKGDGTFEKSGTITVSEKVQNNGSLYLHLYFVTSGRSPKRTAENSKDYELHTVYKSKQLNKFKKRRYHTTKNLLTGTTDAHVDLIRNPNETTVEVLSHWHPNLTINLIDDHTPWTKDSLPTPLDKFIEFLPNSPHYYPIVFFNDYWNLNRDYNPINTTTKVLNLTLTYTPLSLFKWQMYAAQSMRNHWYSFLGDDFMEENDDDQDSLKITFLDTSPYLLAITVIVSLIHSVFEFLAFKNDIQFWRNRKSLEGLSVRSVFFNVFQSLIVLLYILDNETNFVIKVSVFIGLAIEIWKIHKVIDVKLDRTNKLFGLIPRIRFQDKSTYTESKTKQYDMMAFKYLSWVLFPLLVGYAIYSVIYLEHKGWYSWVLSMMYGFLLTFGFIMMTPQLFINYKLKSVAHLPWRMLTYKALNTFIDDLFAFVIKMPLLYRLGCFRDDIVFCIFLYQRWIYRVDPTRVNEFGVSAEMMDEHQANGTAATDPSSQAAVENTETKSESDKKKD